MTEQKLEKLLPCPFHKLNTSVDLTDNDYGRWFVVCGGCGASSGHCKTKERAVYSWNNDRAPTKKETELQAEVERLKVGMAMVEPFLEEITSIGGKYGYYEGAIVYDANNLKRKLKQALNQESKP